MKLNRNLCFSAAFLMLTMPGFLGAQRLEPVLYEKWEDGDRSNQALPESAAWYSSQAGSTLQAGHGKMRQELADSAMTIACFTDPGKTVELAVGHTLRLVYTVSFHDRKDSAFFRIGLYDTSGQDRVSSDAIGYGNVAFEGGRGYMVNLGGLDAGDSVDLRRRRTVAARAGLMNTTEHYWTADGSETSLGETLSDDVPYTGTFEIMRLDQDSVRVTASMRGPDGTVFQTPPYVDRSDTLHFAFDTVGFMSGAGNGDAFTLHSVAVGASPEAAAGMAVTSAAGEEDFPEVAPVDLNEMSPDPFSDKDFRTGWMTPQPLPYYLYHFAAVANSVVTHGDHRGWINRRIWRSAGEFRNRDPRVMESVLSLTYFYTRAEPWNPYHGDPALRKRLEAALRYYIDSLGENGLMEPATPDQHVGFRLANTMFFTKFMGETLVLLRDGPAIDEELHADLLEAQRRALKYVFTSDLAFIQGRQFSNQYGNVFGGAYAYLYLQDDPGIERLLERSIDEVVPHFQSPAGYLYENHSADFGYSLGTHHSNLQAAWHYAQLAGRDTAWLEKETEHWADWLSYNAVPDPDFSEFTLNRAIESRQNRWGFTRANAPFAEHVPALRAFVASRDEVREEEERSRADLTDSWPRVEALGSGFNSFSPYAFLHRHHFEWYPSEAERESARQELPYFARDRFVHQRVDDRLPMEVTFVNRSGYYAAFNAGEQRSRVQTFGLGLLWHPEAGAALQSQTRMAEAAWGVVLEGGDRVAEADGALKVRYYLDGEEISPKSGANDLPDGDLEIHYRLGDRGEKFLRFEDERILVAVNPGGEFIEQIPFLIDSSTEPVVDGESIRIPRGERELVIRPEGQIDQSISLTDRNVGDSTVGVVNLKGFRRFTYTLQFE